MAVPVQEIDVRFEGEQLSLGRSNSNDVVLDDPNVARFHAVVLDSGGVLELRDLGSRCGTRLNGRPVSRAAIRDGAVIGIGPYALRFDGSEFRGRNERGALRLQARGVTVRAGGKQLLDRATLAIEPGELVAIIGESGSGKTTLIRALAGVDAPAEGAVLLNGEPVTARQTDVGYVPQQEIVHRGLSVEEALGYAARLRLPADMEARDRDAIIGRVLAELSLEEHRRTRIGDLSGGQRKRVAVASELLGRPSMLFLDEPTTGLDPALERRLMGLFRELAEPGVRAVVLVTHATRSLEICDRVVVMARGGVPAFIGTPAEALEFFGVTGYDEIYTALEQRDGRAWREAFEAGRGPVEDRSAEPMPEPGPAGSPRARRRTGAHVMTLVGRYATVLSRDRRNVGLLLLQAPLIGLGIALLFRRGLFGNGGVPPDPGRPGEGAQLLFLLATTAIWLGLIDATREIIKERSIAVREAAVGVRWGAYLTSKVLVLFPLAALQVVVLAYAVFALRPLEAGAGEYAVVVGLLVLTAWAAVGCGLLLSALASSEDQATSLIPLALIPQLLFAGAIVPVARMAEPVATLSGLAFSRWSFSGIGSAIDMNSRIAADPAFARASGFATSFFDLPAATAAGVLACFLIGFLAVVAFLLDGRRV